MLAANVTELTAFNKLLALRSLQSLRSQIIYVIRHVFKQQVCVHTRKYEFVRFVVKNLKTLFIPPYTNLAGTIRLSLSKALNRSVRQIRAPVPRRKEDFSKTVKDEIIPFEGVPVFFISIG